MRFAPRCVVPGIWFLDPLAVCHCGEGVERSAAGRWGPRVQCRLTGALRRVVDGAGAGFVGGVAGRFRRVETRAE